MSVSLLSTLGLVAYLWLTLFQILLAAGAPLGRLAWAGAHRVLPRHLRIASLASAAVVALGALAMAQSIGLTGGVLPPGVLNLLLWMLVGLFSLSFLANLFGAHGAERLHGVPLTLICAVSAYAAVTG